MKILALLLSQLVSLECYGQINSTGSFIKCSSIISCQYLLKYKPDSASATAKEDVFFLFVGKECSLFREKQALAHDSLLATQNDIPFNQQSLDLLTAKLKTMSFPTFTYTIYKNRQLQQEVLYYDRIGQNNYSYSEAATLFSWHIMPEKMTIVGYPCQKAVTYFAGRTWEAWFTREIPFSDGPYKFTGLPGLIVRVSDSRQFYTFELVKLKQLAVPQPVLLPTKATIITKQAFLQGKADYEAGAIGRIAAMGNVITDAQKKQFQERVKKRNNPLELK